MPLIAMADYVDGIEQLKIATGYNMPSQYPVGINGLGCGGDCGCGFNKGVSGFGCEECGGVCGRGMSGLGLVDPNEASVKAAFMSVAQKLAADDPAAFNAISVAITSSPGRWDVAADGLNKYIAKQTPTGGPSPTGAGITPQGSSGNKMVDYFGNLVAQFYGAETARKAAKPPRTRVTKVTEQSPDYTTLAVIGGGIIVATVLAVAIGKKR